MNFIRPEVRLALLKWRDAIVGTFVLLLGLYWASGFGVLRWIGVALAIIGGALIYTGLQRARFLAGKDGPGVVTLDEGQISYFGPISGGVVAMSDLSLLMLDPTQKPAMWVLQQAGQSDVHIPVNAEGAELLFDAFASLPDIRTSHMLNTLKSEPDHPVVIWAKSTKQLH